MAMQMSTAFTTADRRKKVMTYGKSARLTAPSKFRDDAPSPERPRKQPGIPHVSLQKPATTLGTSTTLSNARANRHKSPAPRDEFDVPSDDEPTPRPSAAPIKNPPPKTEIPSVFDIPSSGDDRSKPSRKPTKTNQPARMLNPIPHTESTIKPKLPLRDRREVSSSDAPLSAPLPPPRRRAKTPQTGQVPANVERPQPPKSTAVKPKAKSRATTPAPPVPNIQKRDKTTTVLPSKKSSAKQSAKKPPDLDIFDVPSSDEETSARTPSKPRAAPVSRTKVPSVAPEPHASPSPGASIDSDGSNVSNKRKRRASASSARTVKGVEPSRRTREHSVPHRNRKYMKKDDSTYPGRDTMKGPPLVSLSIHKHEEGLTGKPKRPKGRAVPISPRPNMAKGQSSPAKLHSMLAVRSLSKPAIVPEVSDAPPIEDETMYDIKELATPPIRSKTATFSSVTPRQQALFSNLLGESFDAIDPMPSISRLKLTDRKPTSGVSSLTRSSSDIPQSTHTRKGGRLIDMLKQAAPISDVDSESDEETEEDITDIPDTSPPKIGARRKSYSQSVAQEMEIDSEAPTNSQSSQTVVQLRTGARVTYAKQRSYLQESSLEDGLLLSMDLDDDLGLDSEKNQGLVSEDEEDPAQARGIHELRRQGQQHRFEAEAQAAIDDISGKGGLNASQRRSAMMDFATRLADQAFVQQLLESALTSSLLRAISPTAEIIFDFAAAVAILFILESRPGYAMVKQIYHSGITTTLSKLLASNFTSLDITRIAKDRKTNMAPSARDTIAEFRGLILKSSAWTTVELEKLSPQLVALKVLELLVVSLRKGGHSEVIADERTIIQLLDAASGPCLRLEAKKSGTQDKSVLNMTFSILEALSISQETWSNEVLQRLAKMMPVFFKNADTSPIKLVIQLCMNLTNNKPKACQIFAQSTFVIPITTFVSHAFDQLAEEGDEKRRTTVMEGLILGVGAMINLAEYSDQARLSVIEEGDQLVDDLAKIFLEGSARADQADSMEESQTSVTIGYLTVLLGNLCLNEKVRNKVRARMPGNSIKMLVQKVKEFVLYNQRVDRLTGQFDGEEGREAMRNFTVRLMLVVEKLEKAAS